MSVEKMNESKSTSLDELTKTKKPDGVQLAEEELSKAAGGGSTCCAGTHIKEVIIE